MKSKPRMTRIFANEIGRDFKINTNLSIRVH